MKTKTMFGYLIVAMLMISIVVPFALVQPVKAQGTVTISSSNLHPWKVVEIKVNIPGLDVASVDLRITDAAGVPIGVAYKDGTVDNTGRFKAYKIGVGNFYAYLGGSQVNLANNPLYPLVTQNDAIVQLAVAYAGTTINLEVLGHGLTASITYGTVRPSAISLDRTTVPSRRSSEFTVALTVTDQDLNLDPTAVDDLGTYPVGVAVTHLSGSTGLQTTTSASVNVATVRETAINSGTFKPTFTVAVLTPGGVTIRKGDTFLLDVYSDIGWGGDSNKRASTKLDVVYTYPQVSIGFTLQGVTVTVTSPDDNVRSTAVDTLEPGLSVAVMFAGTIVNIAANSFSETGANTGAFRYTFAVAWGAASGLTATTVTLGLDTKSFAITASYLDILGTGSYTAVSPSVSVVKQSPAQVVLLVSDADINMNPSGIDRLDAVVDATNDKISLRRDALTLYELTIKKPDGTILDVPAVYTGVAFFETDFNTGQFRLIMPSANLFEAGKSYTIVVTDHTGDYTVNVPITITQVQVTLDRSEYPINRDKSVVVYVTYVDDRKNVNPELMDTVPADALKYTVVNPVTGETIIAATNVGVLMETAPDSGVFDGMITLSASTPKYIDAKITVYLADTPTTKAEARFKAYQLSASDLKAEPAQISVTGEFTVTVTDPDANVKSISKDTVTVTVVGVGTFTATETGINTGVFTVTLKASDVGATPASTITIKYTERTPVLAPTETSFAGTEYDLVASVKVVSYSGTLTIPKTWIGPYEIMAITVTDQDLNANPALAEQVPRLVKVTVEGTAKTSNIDMTETGVNTGVFTGYLNLPVLLTGVVTPDPKDLAEYIGKTITLVYLDEANAAGVRATLIKTLTITSVNAEVKTDKEAVNIGSTLKITITNLDIAENPAPQFRSVTVKSTTYPTGVSLYASQVQPGVYEVSITVVSLDDWVIGAPQVPATLGDTITIMYTDPIDATGVSKSFTKTVSVGVPVERPVPASSQKFVDPNTGAEKTSGKVGEMILLQATVTNVDVASKSFTAVFKVKDSAGATVYIGIASGTLAPGQSLTPGVSWTPAAAGTYTVEVLVLKSIAEPTPYSEKLSMTLPVV